MATLHGYNGMIYLGATSGGAAAVITEAYRWSVDVDRDTSEDSAFGDTWKTFLSGMLSWSMSATFNHDTAEAIPFNAATQLAGTVRVYLYPNRATTTQYYYGFCYPKLSVEVAKDGTVTGTMEAQGSGQLALN